MTGLFTALGSLALLLLLVGLVKPRWVLPPRWKPNRWKSAGVYLGALLVFSALLNAVSPAPDPASVAAAQEAAAAIEAQARRDAQANRPADPPPVAPVGGGAQIVVAEPKAEAEARQEEQAKRDADQQREAEAKRIAAEKAKADKRALEAASLPVKRSALVALAKTWGWDCKPPSPIETSAVIDSRHVMIPTEVTFCAHPSNLDSFRIYATATATHLIGYTGDQMDPKHDLTAVADARLTQVAKLLSLEALDKEVRAAVQKQRDYSRDNSCKGLMDCPLYDEERVGNGIKLRQRAKPKVSWEWTFSIETRQGDDLLKAQERQEAARREIEAIPAGEDTTPTPAPEEQKKAEALKKTLGVTTKDALAKISAWGIPLKPGPAGQWSAINEEKAVMLTLDERNGKLVKFEYGGFMVKNSPNNTQHFMRVRQAMDWLLKNARKEDKDKIIAEVADALSTEKPITYDVEKQGEIRSTYSAAIGLWVFVVEAK